VDELAGTQSQWHDRYIRGAASGTSSIKGDNGQCSAVGLKALTVTGEEYGQDKFQRIEPLNSDVCINPGCKIFQKSSRQPQIPIRQMDDMKQVPF